MNGFTFFFIKLIERYVQNYTRTPQIRKYDSTPRLQHAETFRVVNGFH